MAALKALPGPEQIEFVRLRKIVDAANSGARIQTLEQAGYMEARALPVSHVLPIKNGMWPGAPGEIRT
ncbi:MAG TPA: hypothetical protein VKB67_00435, partial [Rhizomicrobium sp.]|nr:hypothetical protein [Rhizomicrobium sp.]